MSGLIEDNGLDVVKVDEAPGVEELENFFVKREILISLFLYALISVGTSARNYLKTP